jgi:hypothetical protein
MVAMTRPKLPSNIGTGISRESYSGCGRSAGSRQPGLRYRARRGVT